MTRTGAFDPGPQSGARATAPGRLGLVQAFVNSHFDLEEDWGADLWASPAGLERWLSRRDLASGRPTRAEHGRARTVRRGLRAQLAVHNDLPADPEAEERLREAIGGLVTGFGLTPAGELASVATAPGVAGALGLVLAVVHEAQLQGTWRRLKLCPGEDCGWVFYDSSRNLSGRWCSMSVCGGREKSRAYRRRSGGAARGHAD